MKKLLFIGLIVVGGCAHQKVYTITDVKDAYKKGLKVGRVIGRDDILYELKSPDCFTQPVDELMLPQAERRFAPEEGQGK